MKKMNFFKKYLTTIRGVFITSLILISIQTSQAQTNENIQYTRPSWFVGVVGGANLNFYQGSTQKLTNDFTSPSSFQTGQGVGLYAAPLLEYHKPNSIFGFMLQSGYDNRQGIFKKNDFNSELSTDIAYISIEPSLRISPFRGNFYIYAGPRFAYNISKGFDYKEGDIEPVVRNIKGDFSDINKTQISMQVGTGYDIYLSSQNRHIQFILSPFVTYLPYLKSVSEYVEQSPRSIESWKMSTVRAGVALKFGNGREIPPPPVVVVPEKVFVPIPVPEVNFTINSPKNISSNSNNIENYPIRNYVFFDVGSTKIPSRYIKIKSNEVKDYKVKYNSDNQMGIYYNILNIVGERMVKYPSTKIVLVGSSEKGIEDGKQMSLSIKNYLISTFDIEESRISIEGKKNKPILSSQRKGEEKDLISLRESDRRVTIESPNPELFSQYEIQSNNDTTSVSPVESYIQFNVENGTTAFTSWSLEISDSVNKVQKFGPYTEDKISIPTETILGKRQNGSYKVTMVGLLKNGDTIKKYSSMDVSRWNPTKNINSMKFSIIFDFDSFVVSDDHRNYLINTIVPKIPTNGIVILNGYTDDIGEETYNMKLSLKRSNAVKDIIVNELTRLKRNDVTINTNGLGETGSFDNTLPEGEFYNRTVIINLNSQK